MERFGETNEYPYAAASSSAAAGRESDESLAERAASDPLATEELYRRYVHRVYAYCKRRLPDEDAARDATSTIMLKALEGLYRTRVTRVASWIFSIAHNEVVSVYRQRRETVGLEFAAHIAGDLSPEHQLMTESEAGELRALIAQLRPDQQQVVTLRLAGLDGGEISTVLGRSRAWVDTTQYRAVRRLRDLLGGGPDPEAAR